MILGVHHVGLRVAAAQRARAVLAAAVALEETPLPGWLRGPNVYLHLEDGPELSPRAPHAVGLAHVCVQAADGKPTFARLEHEGARFIAPLTGMGGPFLYAYGHLPGGALIELEGAPCAPTGGPQAWFGHLAIVTPDIKELSAFYAALLHLPIVRGGRLQNSPTVDTITGLADVDVRVCWIHGLNLGLEFWSYAQPPAPAPEASDPATGLHVLALLSDNLDQDIAHARELGAVLVNAPRPDETGVRAELRDPHGNALRLVKAPQSNHPLAFAHLPHADALTRFAAAMSAAA
jgi:catechol 2,3-dioxygenase-like lactoylglutathione lyase family enzyme